MPGRPRSSGGRSDTSDADMEGHAESELLKHHRQYRIMIGDRSVYTQESQHAIAKQKSQITQLEGEQNELVKDLRLSESRANQIADDENVDKLVELGNTMDDQGNSIDDEKKHISDLDMKIKEWEKKVRVQQKNMGGVHMSAAHTINSQQKVRKMENQLDQAIKKFNSFLTDNQTLRNEIESLRVERVRFDNLNKKLDKELMRLRREIGEVIENSSQSYESREEAQAKMMLLREKADKDIQQHNADMKELVRIIDHDKKLKEFMRQKGMERAEDSQLAAWKKKRDALEAERKKASQEDSVESYEEAFKRIKEMTGEEDLDALVGKFIEVEDRNFALFNYVNEQNNELEMLQGQIEGIHYEIEKFKTQGVEMESQRKAILKQLEERQVAASKDADESELKNVEISKILDQLRAGVESLFSKINCERSVIDDMLGAMAGVTDSNMLQYLGIIEQRTNELLAAQGFIGMQDQEKYDQTRAVTLLGDGPPAPTMMIPVFPPAVGDDYESEASEASDEDSRPYTRAELQAKVMKTVKKRESAARKEGFKYDLSNAREKTQKKEKKDAKK